MMQSKPASDFGPRVRKSVRWPLASLNILILLFCLGQQTVSKAEEAPEPAAQAKLHVLFVGNSYTHYNNLPRLLELLSQADESSTGIITDMIAPGGAKLEVQWKEGVARAKIRSRQWDYVVLQDHSLRALEDPESLKRAVRLFDADIKKAGAKTILFFTWAREKQPEKQAQISEVYRSAAKEVGALLAPVGEAWAEMRDNQAVKLYIEDGSHPTPIGTLLNAFVFYSLIEGKSPQAIDLGPLLAEKTATTEKSWRQILELPAQDASALAGAAWKTAHHP
jgi:hypothetical protein